MQAGCILSRTVCTRKVKGHCNTCADYYTNPENVDGSNVLHNCRIHPEQGARQLTQAFVQLADFVVHYADNTI